MDRFRCRINDTFLRLAIRQFEEVNFRHEEAAGDEERAECGHQRKRSQRAEEGRVRRVRVAKL